MFNELFWRDFLSNALSTLIVGIILGGVVTLIISRISRKEEKKIDAHRFELAKANKKLAFLKIIKEELVSIIVAFQVNQQKYKNIGILPYIQFDISYWELLKAGGEIPSLFDPMTIQSITLFYSHVSKCNTLYEMVLAAENSGNAHNRSILKKELQDEIFSVYSMIETFKIELIIDQESESTKRIIETLESMKKYTS